MKSFFVFVLVIAAQAGYAQMFTINDIYSPDSSRAFIELKSAQRASVAKRIEADLQKDWGYNPTAKDPFENIQVVEQADFYAKVMANNERVLALQLESSYASCGLHVDRRFYYFDARTGARLDLNGIFTTEANAKLSKALAKVWKAKLKSAAKETNNSFYQEQYQACSVAAEKITDVDPGGFNLYEDGIAFWADGCLEGTAYEFEADVSRGPFKFSLGQLLPYLSPYGYSLYVNPLKGPLQTLMHGTIDGKYPISLTLLHSKDGDDKLAGFIVYDRVGEPINLSGTINGNQLVFHELDASNNALSDIEVTWDGAKLAGSFINLKSKKQMPFVASVAK